MIMAYVLRKIGNADNVAVNYYEVDTEHDMLEIDVANAPMGSRCYIINIGSTYVLNSNKEWKLVPPVALSDWNQNDLSAKDYVKNRTHWAQVETQNLPEQKLESPFLELSPLVLQTIGAPISITIDGTMYSGVTKSFDFNGNTLVYFGNLSLAGLPSDTLEDTGESFLLGGNDVGTSCMIIIDEKKYPDSLPTVSGSWQSLVYHKLSNQFLPTTVSVMDNSGETLKEYTPKKLALYSASEDMILNPVYFNGHILGVEHHEQVFARYQEIRVPFEYNTLHPDKWVDYTFDDATLAETLRSALPNPGVYTAVRLMDKTLKYHYCLMYQMSTSGIAPGREMIAAGFSNWYNEKFPVCVQIKTVGDTITVSVKGLA